MAVHLESSVDIDEALRLHFELIAIYFRSEKEIIAKTESWWIIDFFALNISERSCILNERRREENWI